ncbi:hypothetical protein RYX36_007803 [Vicia faba]
MVHYNLCSMMLNEVGGTLLTVLKVYLGGNVILAINISCLLYLQNSVNYRSQVYSLSSSIEAIHTDPCILLFFSFQFIVGLRKKAQPGNIWLNLLWKQLKL